MTHEVRIEHDERFLARPWGVVCSCGHKTANESREEAQQSLAAHRKGENEYGNLD
jgi:hypothetical protein